MNEANDPSEPAPAVALRPSLLVMSRAGVFTAPLPAEGTLALGRGEECELRIDDTKASRRHAVLHVREGRVEVEDLGSTNGTLVGERRLSANVPIELRAGDMITIGSTVLVLQSAPRRPPPQRLWSQSAFAARLDEERRVSSETGAPFAVVRVRFESGSVAHTTTSTQGEFAADLARAEALEAILRTALRPSDVLASYAAGAYEMLLPGVTPEVAGELAAEMESRLRDAGVRAEASVSPHPPHANVQLDDGAMKRLEPVLERVAASHVNVLILGETGVGKEVLARTIHERSSRATHPLVCVNCGALSATLLESELFGHERGAFTGAVQAKPGLIEAAEGGTVFLDEIGEMPIELQVKLLRVLEQREVLRVGAVKPRPIDVRFLSATHRDLEAEIESGGFRQDLYFRLNVIAITIPPLRARVDEIETLARQFVRAACERAGRATVPALAPQVIAILRRHAWPGNIRELRNMMERAMVLCDGDTVTVESLPQGKLWPAVASRAVAQPAAEIRGPLAQLQDPLVQLQDQLAAQTRDVERRRIVEALERCVGNQTHAAKLLGISRRTLVTRIEEFDLPRPRKRPSPG